MAYGITTSRLKSKLKILVLSLLALLWYLSTKGSENIHKMKCEPGYFHLLSMPSCHPWLTCSDVEDVKIQKLIGEGAVKRVFLAEWKGHQIAYSEMANEEYIDDFMFGIDILIRLQPSKYVIQMVGYCKEKHVLWTEYHKNGDASNIIHLMQTRFGMFDSARKRLQLCIRYAKAIDFLHNSPAGTCVMCDSNELSKLLGQLLVTDDLDLIVNDVDSLAVLESENKSIKCGHRQITGHFVAPEQIWPFPRHIFDDSKMPGYNEKTDIWKMATVCSHFLGRAKGSEVVRYHLFNIHKKCKSNDPHKRPTAKDLVNKYVTVYKDLALMSDL